MSEYLILVEPSIRVEFIWIFKVFRIEVVRGELRCDKTAFSYGNAFEFMSDKHLADKYTISGSIDTTSFVYDRR